MFRFGASRVLTSRGPAGAVPEHLRHHLGRVVVVDDAGDRNPDMSHLPKWGEGNPTMVEQGTLPAYVAPANSERSTDTAKRWPELRPSRARTTREVSAGK
jgi:hypothetical protein